MKITTRQLMRIIKEVAAPHQPEDAERQELYELINDLEKDAYGFRMRRDLSSWTTQRLRDEADYLSDRIRSDIETEELESRERAELETSETEIAGLMPSAEEIELERLPAGKVARRYEGKKMRISKDRLAKIIKEEAARVIFEMEIVNAETGELITLSPELEGEYNDGQELSHEEFEELRLRLNPSRSARQSRRRWSPDEETIASARTYPGSPATSTAVERLMILARDAADDWMADNPDGNIDDVAYDLADGLRWSADGDDWADATEHFGSKADLVWALAEEMTG